MLLIVDHDTVTRAELIAALRSAVDGVMGVDPGGVADVLERDADALTAALIGPSGGGEGALRVAAELQSRLPELGFVVLARDVSPQLLQASLRAGARDVLPTSCTVEDLRTSVGRATELTRVLRARTGAAAPPDPGQRGTLVTVFSSKGGCGRSVIASNLAVLLARSRQTPVALVDLDLGSGDAPLLFQVAADWTLHDVVVHGHDLDAESLRGHLVKHPSGVHILAAPRDPSAAEAVRPGDVRDVLALLRSEYRYVVVDGPASYTDQVLVSIDASDLIVLVGSMDVLSVKNLHQSLQTLRRLGLRRDQIQVVLNRADSKVGLTVREVERTLRTGIDLTIPSTREIPLSVNQGRPLVMSQKRSKVLSRFQTLAEAIPAPPPVGSAPPVPASGGLAPHRAPAHGASLGAPNGQLAKLEKG